MRPVHGNTLHRGTGGYPEVAQVGKDVIEGEVPLGFEDSLLGMTS
jgi:hypothetical protein